MKVRILLASVALAATGIAVATAQVPAPADSAAADSAATRIMPHIGTASLALPYRSADLDRWQWTGDRSLAQVIERVPGIFLRSQGEPGAAMGYSWLGGAPAHDGIMLDVVPLGDPVTGRVNLSLVPLEYLDGIERLSGPVTLLHGNRWNLISRQFSTVRPITAIRFVQEPNETILSDGYFTQNIARSTNLLFGFQRHTTQGRFANAALDAWNLRGRIRANLAVYVNLIGAWTYERSTRGVNGGVNRSLSHSVFDNLSAVVFRPSGYEIYERTDVSITAVGRFLGDSLSPTRVSFFSRSIEREYRRPPDVTSTIEEQLFTRARDARVSVEQVVALPFVHFRAGGEYGSTRLRPSEVFSERTVTRSKLGLLMRGTVVDWFIPSVAFSVQSLAGDRAEEVAATLEVNPGAGLRLSADVHRRPLFPTLQEQFWQDSTVIRPLPLKRGREQMIVAAVRWSWDSSSTFSLEAFQRQLTGAVLARPGTTAGGTPAVLLTQTSPTWSGFTAMTRWTVWYFELSGEFTFATVTSSDSLDQLLPRWWGTGELAYQSRIFREELGIRVGVRSRFSDRLRGLSPDPTTGFELVNTTLRIGRAATLDVYGTMQIGDAFVSLSWENVTDASWLRTAVYPMPDRQFKLGVRWVFQD